MTGIFTEVVKGLIEDADRAFSSGILGRAVKSLAKPPDPTGGPRLSGALSGAGGQAGKNVFVAAVTPPANPVPLLKQILSVLETLALKIGLFNRVAGKAAPAPLRQQVSQIAQRIYGPAFSRGTPNAPGAARYQFQQIAQQLRAPPVFTAVAPGRVAGAVTPAAGASGIARGLLIAGRFAGILGIVTGLLGTAAAAIQSFVSGVMQQNENLARYNGRIAASLIRLGFTRQRLDIQQAGAVSGPAAGLNEEMEKLLVEIQPIRESVGRLSNLVAGGIVYLTRSSIAAEKQFGILQKILPGFGAIVEIMKLIELWIGAAPPGAAPLNVDLRALQNPGAPAPNRPLKTVPRAPWLPPMV